MPEVKTCFRRKSAVKVAERLNQRKRSEAGRSSGWARYDYSYKRDPTKKLKKWVVYSRAQRI